MTRPFSLKPSLANLLADLRRTRGVDGPTAVRLQDLEDLEAEFECILPDAIVAYLAAEVSVFGDSPVSIARCKEITLAYRDMSEESGRQPSEDDELVEIDDLIFFDDDSNGNAVAFRRGTERGSDVVFELDHEGWEVVRLSLADACERALEGATRSAETITVELVDRPDLPPPERWVSHVKFGRGLIVREQEDKLTIRFDGDLVKTLKSSFVTFE